MNAPDLTALTPEERYHTERQQEGMHLLDYASASAIVALGAAAFFFLARAYWTLHGGSVETFSFWATGDIRWLEVLFWALLTSIAWNTTQAAGALAEEGIPDKGRPPPYWPGARTTAHSAWPRLHIYQPRHFLR